MSNWENKRNELISKLPTILDILEHLAKGEIEFYEKMVGSMFKYVLPTINQEGLFEIISYPDGTDKVVPLHMMQDYYRGESSPHFPSYPSLYRKGMTDDEILIERVKTCELSLLIETFPIYQVFKSGISYTFPDNSVQVFNLSVDAEALAQHYGIKTQLMDLTVDKFVAAFFATTIYKDGKYYPVDPEQDDMPKYGLFYDYVDSGINDFILQHQTGCYKPKLRVVGFQPLSRPAEQRGYVLNMKKGEDFHKLCRRRCYKFRHDAKVSQLIFNYTNRSNKLFPYSIMEEKANKIIKSKSFSKSAVELTVLKYYPQKSYDEIVSILKGHGISISRKPIVRFTEEEKKAVIENWNAKGFKEFQKQVCIRPVYRGPMKEK